MITKINNYHMNFDEALTFFNQYKEENKEDLNLNKMNEDDYIKAIGVESDLYHFTFSCRILDFLNMNIKDRSQYTKFVGTSGFVKEEVKDKYRFDRKSKCKNAINGLKFQLNKNNFGGSAVLETENVVIKLAAYHGSKSTPIEKAKALIYFIKKSDDIKDFKVQFLCVPISLLFNKTFWFEEDENYYAGCHLRIK